MGTRAKTYVQHQGTEFEVGNHAGWHDNRQGETKRYTRVWSHGGGQPINCPVVVCKLGNGEFWILSQWSYSYVEGRDKYVDDVGPFETPEEALTVLIVMMRLSGVNLVETTRSDNNV